jgi:4'-phosphopantetheinyl transferase
VNTEPSLPSWSNWPTASESVCRALRGRAGTPKHSGDLFEEVHLWAATLAVGGEPDPALSTLLTDQEQERAARFRFPVHRTRFTVSRVFLRSLLGLYLDLPGAEVQFSLGPYGKPELAGAGAGTELRFNLTHSEDLALVAITKAGPVGVDVERMRLLEDMEELVDRFFSVEESAVFRELDPKEKTAAFFNLWTRKESWLKATGLGIGTALNRVEVAFLPGEPAALVRLPSGFGSTHSWFMQQLEPADGFVGAVAVNARSLKVRPWCWTPVGDAFPDPLQIRLA